MNPGKGGRCDQLFHPDTDNDCPLLKEVSHELQRLDSDPEFHIPEDKAACSLFH